MAQAASWLLLLEGGESPSAAGTRLRGAQALPARCPPRHTARYSPFSLLLVLATASGSQGQAPAAGGVLLPLCCSAGDAAGPTFFLGSAGFLGAWFSFRLST